VRVYQFRHIRAERIVAAASKRLRCTSVRTGRLSRDDGTVVCEHCLLAVSPLTRLRGLHGRSSLAPGEGMLFRPCGSIHMFFMRFAIDAIFCDRDLRVLAVVRGLKPWRMASCRRARIVVELAEGAAADVRLGDQLVLDTIEA
jgi:uncharacterized membrane protein (UPF0127 family)